jgi:hypothetical protein
VDPPRSAGGSPPRARLTEPVVPRRGPTTTGTKDLRCLSRRRLFGFRLGWYAKRVLCLGLLWETALQLQNITRDFVSLRGCLAGKIFGEMLL